MNYWACEETGKCEKEEKINRVKNDTGKRERRW